MVLAYILSLQKLLLLDTISPTYSNNSIKSKCEHPSKDPQFVSISPLISRDTFDWHVNMFLDKLYLNIH